MTTPYDADKFTGLRPWSNEEPTDEFKDSELAYDTCRSCGEPDKDTFVSLCPACIMAFEEADAPEELAITLGNMSIDDYPEERSPSLTEEIFGGIYYR